MSETRRHPVRDSHDSRHEASITVPFACEDGSRVSVTLKPESPGSPEDAVAHAREVVRKLAVAFSPGEEPSFYTPEHPVVVDDDDAVYRSWAFDQ